MYIILQHHLKNNRPFLQESQDFERHWKQTLHTCLDRSYQRHGSWISEPSTGPVLVSDRWLSQQLSLFFYRNFEPRVQWCPEINIFKYDLKLVNHYLILWYVFFNKYGWNVCEVELPLGFHMQSYAPCVSGTSLSTSIPASANESAIFDTVVAHDAASETSWPKQHYKWA